MSQVLADIMSAAGTPSNNRTGGRSTVTATPATKRREALLSNFDTDPQNMPDPPSFLLAKQCAAIIYSVLGAAVDQEHVKHGLHKLFQEELISDTKSLSYLKETKLPSGPYDIDINGSKITVNYFHKEVFKSILMEIVDACDVLAEEGRHLHTKSDAAHIKSLAKLKNSGGAITEIITESSSRTPRIPDFNLDPYDDMDLDEWLQKTEKDFGSKGCDKYLTNEQDCLDNDEVSYALVCKLQRAIHDSHISHLNAYPNDKERNCAIFWSKIKDQCNEAQEKAWKQVTYWQAIMDARLSSMDTWNKFHNDLSIALSKLTEEKSVAITDVILFKALILKAIDGDGDFKDAKKELVRNTYATPNAIIAKLKEHADTMATSSRYDGNGNQPGQSKSRRANRASNSKTSFASTNEYAFRVPKLPKNLEDYMRPGVGFKQIGIWKSMAATCNSKEAYDRVNNFSIRGGEPLLYPFEDGYREQQQRLDRDKSEDRGASRRHSHHRHADRYNSYSRSGPSYDRNYRDRERGRSRDRDRDRGSRRSRSADRSRSRDGGRGRPSSRSSRSRSHDRRSRDRHDDRRSRRAHKRPHSPQYHSDSDGSYYDSRSSRRAHKHQDDRELRGILKRK